VIERLEILDRVVLCPDRESISRERLQRRIAKRDARIAGLTKRLAALEGPAYLQAATGRPPCACWQPVSCAPLDGTPVLLRLRERHDFSHSLPAHPMLGRWSAARRCWEVMWLGWFRVPFESADGTSVVLAWRPLD
jgi:hypothetical protein